jgi:protein FAM32A
MPSSDYASAIGGGLKLKGVSSGGIDKKKKKSKKNKDHSVSKEDTSRRQIDPITSTAASKDRSVSPSTGDKTQRAADDDEDGALSTTKPQDDSAMTTSTRETSSAAYKTVAQRKHDEQRRKRLDERLRREGVQTHKERVEQLNKYLSGLSEHHDMPRIGPG